MCPPDPSISPGKWSQTFPLNHLVLSFLDSITNSKCPKTQTTKCEPRRHENESTCNTSSVWCDQCKEALCDTCQGRHRIIIGSPEHKTVPLENIRVSDFKITEDRCMRHIDKTYEVYCCDHDELCCVLCLAVIHRHCKNIQTLHEITDRGQINYGVILGHLSEIKDNVLKILDGKQGDVKYLKIEASKKAPNKDDVVDPSNVKLDNLKSELKPNVNPKCTTSNTSLLKGVKMLQSFLINIDQYQKSLQSAIHNGSQIQAFITHTIHRKRLTTHFGQLKSEIYGDSKMSLIYGLDDLIDKLETLGGVGVRETHQTSVKDDRVSIDKTIQRIINKCEDVQAPGISASVDFLLTTVQFVKSISRSAKGFHHADITGGVFLNDGRLLLTNYENELLLLDSSFQILKAVRTNARPTDVVKGSNEREVHVAFETINSVVKYDIYEEFKTLTKMKVRKSLCGIDVYKENAFAAINDEGISMMSLNGGAIATFPAAGEYRYVRVVNNKIYHTDDDAVICRSIKGKVLFKYERPSLKTPTGICLDSNENVYVVGQESGNIHQISSDGQRSRVLIDKLRHIKKPWAVVVSIEMNMIFISSSNERYKFEVYELTM